METETALMSNRRRGLGPWVLVLCLLAATTSAGLMAPAPVGAIPAKGFKLVKERYYDDPIGRMAYDLRERTHRADPARGHANLNLAIGFVDITGLQDVSTYPYEILDTASLKQRNRALYDRLELGTRPWVRTLLVVPHFNTPQRVVGFNPTYALHSEEHILRILDKRGIPEDRLVGLYSDRSPCQKRCAPKIPNNTTVFFAVKDGRGSSQALENEIYAAKAKRHDEVTAAKNAERARQAAALFNPDPGAAGTAGGALPQALSQPGRGRPGGIDLSSLQLRYLAEAGGAGGLRYAFAGRHGATNDDAAGLRVAKEASDAFFIWLALPTPTFTVNLNPDEPHRIINAKLARTDAGRVLLEADLRLKQTAARLLHPDTRLGARFWRAVPGDPFGVGDCNAFRQWIVPAPATVYEQEGELYILDAPLSVKLEGEYRRPAAGIQSPFCAGRQRRLEALLRTLVLPKVEHAVNTAPEYAALRRVYLSRVAAEWYRQRSLQQPTALSGLIDSGDIGRWTARRSWSPDDVFKRYVRSYIKGEFNITRQTRSGNVIETRTYIFGGVDFSSVPTRSVAAAELQGRWPGLAETARRVQERPAAGPRGREVWLGGVAPAAAGVAGDGSRPVAVGLQTVLTLLLLALGLSCVLGARRLARGR
jgi:hypothetical protein